MLGSVQHHEMLIQVISDAASIPASVVASLVYGETGRYRHFDIPKSSGGTRRISTPIPSLHAIQRYIYKSVIFDLPVHDSAKGYRPKTSIIDYVRPHLGAKSFIKVDIKDCFPSISTNSVFKCLMRNGFSRKNSFIISRLCTQYNGLPQGAPHFATSLQFDTLQLRL